MSLSANIFIDLVIFATFAFTILYLYAQYRYGYWKRKGVFSPKASFPGGHIGKVITGKEHIGVLLGSIYQETKQHPFVGLYMLFSKTLMINDLDLIKAILVKDFQHFPDHGLGVSESDPLSNHLINMEGEVWKAIRMKLTPTFTSNKMKYMFNTILKCSDVLEDYIEEQVKHGNDVDFRENLARYGTDVIGSCAFGIETNSFKYPDAEFRKMGKKCFEIDFFKSFRDMMSIYAPWIIKNFKIRLINKDIEDFFVKTITETVKYREENNITRNDFLQLLIDMKKKDELSGNGHCMSLVEITAQVFLFFVAGFETSSATSSYAMYELAKNKHVQDKLREEIDRVTEKHNGKITYECILEMEYLTQVIEESLRMYPPVPFLFRLCAKDYKIPDSNVTIEKGTQILLPTFGIHRDPDIHEDPEEFRPERFSPENKASMHQFASIPFGEGPRICIGNRFGMMQSRLGIVKTLSKFEVSLPKVSTETLKFEPKSFFLTPTQNDFLKVTRRRPK
ncbi:cytochrome P450 6a2-like [Arctopsyche grandis]|uniref:cytochrome P450 6a2-like n=1 Tax=Arctopsyche grandis TaxID=121162 RepID=UPI00406D7BD2